MISVLHRHRDEVVIDLHSANQFNPRDGFINSAMLYMEQRHGIPLFDKTRSLMERWNREDPPDREERRRNEKIFKYQGTRNRFIDNPSAAEQLRF